MLLGLRDGIPSLRTTLRAGGLRYWVYAWVRTFSYLFWTLSPAISKYTRRRMSEFADVAKSQINLCPARSTFLVLSQAAAKSFDFLSLGSAALRHFPTVTIVDLFSGDSLSIIY